MLVTVSLPFEIASPVESPHTESAIPTPRSTIATVTLLCFTPDASLPMESARPNQGPGLPPPPAAIKIESSDYYKRKWRAGNRGVRPDPVGSIDGFADSAGWGYAHLLVVALVVFLGAVESCGWDDLSYDRAAEFSRRIEALF